MIHEAIEHLSLQLNQHLMRRFGLLEDVVVVSGLVEPDATRSPLISNKMIVALVNVVRDTSPHQANRPPSIDAHQVRSVAPLYLNLHVMVAGHFSGRNYPEALKFLSATIAFFQRSPVFDHASSPALDQGIERLTLEIENIPLAEMSHLWSVIGGKYLPSVLYRVRMVVIESDDIVDQVPAIVAPSTRVSGASPLSETAADRDRRQRAQDEPE